MGAAPLILQDFHNPRNMARKSTVMAQRNISINVEMSLYRHGVNITIFEEMSKYNPDMESLLRRKCGSCTLCCRVLSVQQIQKPAGVLCAHCDEGWGCRIHETRPEQCRSFHCYFLTNPGLREHWRPSKSHMVVVVSGDGSRIAAHVDPNRPGAWRREPFYSTLKDWARQAVSRPGMIGQVLVSVGKHVFVILPERNVDVGLVEDDEVVITEAVPGANGLSLDAFKIKRDDPRAAAMLGAAEKNAAGSHALF